MTSIALKMKSNDVESCGVGYVFGYDEEDPILGLAVRCVWKSTDHLKFSFSPTLFQTRSPNLETGGMC